VCFDRKQVYSWASYDWANSAFATTVMAAILPTYYSKVVAATLPAHLATSYWGYSNTIAMLSMALLAPILGAIADYKKTKLKFLSRFAVLGIVCTALLYFVQGGDWLYALVLYIIARIGFSGANVFYDSLLPHISTKENIDRVSTLGYAAGYCGGGLLLALNMSMILYPNFFAISDAESATRLSFLTVAMWWGIFSIPILKNVGEPDKNLLKSELKNPIRSGYLRLLATLKQVKKFKQAFRFLMAFWFYNDGIGTIMIMAVIFGAEIGIGTEHLIGAILTVQFIGIPFTILFAKIAAKFSTKHAIYIGLSVYSFISIAGYFMENALHFWLLAIMVGMVQGGTQALSRSLFGRMTPKHQSAEFFGFFDVSQKFSGILGPALFALVAQLTGSSRLSIVALIVFFIGGMIILTKVKIAEGVAIAVEEDKQALST
jgi:UMF1 family MFS transporter